MQLVEKGSDDLKRHYSFASVNNFCENDIFRYFGQGILLMSTNNHNPHSFLVSWSMFFLQGMQSVESGLKFPLPAFDFERNKHCNFPGTVFTAIKQK